MSAHEQSRVAPPADYLDRAAQAVTDPGPDRTTVEALAALAPAYVGSWCIVTARESSRLIFRAVLHEDPDKQALLQRICLRQAGPMAKLLGLRRVLESRRPRRVERIDPQGLRELDDVESATLLERVDLGAHSSFPLVSRDRVIGVVTFGAGGSAGADRSTGAAPLGEAAEGIARDLSARLALALDNARLLRRAEEADRSKADFLAVISHELRTPLSAILGYSDLLAAGVKGPVNDAQKDQLGRIEQSVRHMVQLVDELISYARVDAGTTMVDPAPVDVEAVARSAVGPVQAEAAQKGLDLHVDVEIRGAFRTDARMLRQIVVNLLTNAVKYTREGEVGLRVRCDDDTLVVEVRDTGIGITEEDQKRVFEPFWQAESPNTRRFGGAGIGLSLTRRLVDTLGGTLELDSTFGEGSTFCVRLPPL